MWVDDLKTALHCFYDSAQNPEIVGYLRGGGTPHDWTMSAMADRHQSLILGNVLPTRQDWIDAGVGNRVDAQHTITVDMLRGWMILQNGGSPRPWGKIFPIDRDVEEIGFPASLRTWQRNYC